MIAQTISAARSFAARLALWWKRPVFDPPNGPRSESRNPAAPQTAISVRVAVIVGVGLCLLSAAGSYARATLFTPVIHQYYGYGVDAATGPHATNLLFDGDVPKVTLILTNRFSEKHQHTAEHPLMSLIMVPPVKLLSALGLSELTAMRVTVAGACALWAALMFSLLLAWGCRVLDAAVFTVLGQFSAAAMFWYSVPEVYPLGALTILLALLLTLWPRRVDPIVRYTAASVISISMTVTNVMVAIIAAVRRLPPRSVWAVGASGFLIVALLFGLQYLVFPRAEFFFPPRSGWLAQYYFPFSPARIAEVSQVFLSHTMVMPEIQMLSGDQIHLAGSTDRMMSVQHSVAGNNGALNAVATIAWLLLLALGLWAARATRSSLAALCLLIGLCQILLHVRFGSETFLYTLHMLPLLVIVAAGVTFTRLRPIALALAATLIIAGGANNAIAFQEAARIVHETDAYARTFPGADPTPSIVE